MELIILSNFIKNYDKILKSNITINVEGKMHYIYLLFII